MVSSLPKTDQIQKKFSDEKKTQLFDVIHGVQHNGYLKASRIIRRNISVWLPSYIVSHGKEIYSNKTITMIHSIFWIIGAQDN